MRTLTPYIQMPKGYTKGNLPQDFIHEYVREFNDPLGILIEAIRLLRQNEKIYESKQQEEKTTGTD